MFRHISPQHKFNGYSLVQPQEGVKWAFVFSLLLLLLETHMKLNSIARPQ